MENGVNGSNGSNGSGKQRVLTTEVRPNGVAIVSMDIPHETMNTLQANFASEFSDVFSAITANPDVKAVVFTSGKPDNFIAGADVRMLRDAKTASEAAELSRTGQRALNMIAASRVPVVAAIHGACLGGGLEVALACHARVASSDSKTKLGVPEVQLGLLPAAGGTQRLPRLIGVQNALDLMLTGKQVDGKKAKRMGLVDEVVPRAILLDVAAKIALERAEESEHKQPAWKRVFHKEEISELLLADNPLGRKILFDQARKRAQSKTQGNYPAVDKILDVVKLGLAKGMERGLEAEAEAFGELVVSPEARSLMSIFFAITDLKKDPGHDVTGVEEKPVRKAAVLGAGLMGAGVAYVTAALAKTPVRLKDRDAPSLQKGLRYAREIVDERVKRRRMTPAERDLLMTRLSAATDYSGFKDADIVIEAVFEDLELKRRMVADVEQHAHKDTIFASNTSSLPIAKIAEGAKRPEQVIGMHYFSPVHKMPLLEIIVTPQTAPWVIQSCVELGKKQGKTVIVVRDGAGFYTTRILGPYMNEASFLLAEGVAVDKIDRALVKWGFPVGPITLLDEVGIDVGAKVAHVLHDAFGERMAPPPGVEKLLGDNRLGKKNQRGFYVYSSEKGKKHDKVVDTSVYTLFGIEPSADPPANDIAQRCALQMVNEAAYCYGDGILRSARDGDIGAIFGLGFPPFRGGPFRYIDAVGASEIVRRLQVYADQHGKRFTPAPVLLEMAKSGQTFHGERVLPAGRHGRGEATAVSVGSA